MGVAIVGQDLAGDEPLDEVKGFAGSNVVTVDNLSTTIWSIEESVSANNVVVNVIGKLDAKISNIMKLR